MASDLIIRRLGIEDYDDIVSLWSRAGLPIRPKGRDSREMISVEMSRSYCAFIGLYDNEKMLAVGLANFDGRRGWINRVAVDPDYRGLGLAGRIIEAGEEFLRGIGAVVMCALIEEENAPSMDTFEAAGYTCEPKFKMFTKRPSPDA